MFKVTVGHSCDPDATLAIQDVIDSCQQDLADTSPCAGLLLAAPDYEHQILLDALNAAFPNLELIGGTTNSELSSQEGFQQDSLVLILFSSDSIEIRAGLGLGVGNNPQAAAQQAITQATASLTQSPKLCIPLPDGLTSNGSKVVSALTEVLNSPAAIVGGTTGEDFMFEVTHQFYHDQVLTDALPILLFAGDLQFSFGVSSGCGTLGSKGLVTKATENVILEINHQSARLFYDDYFNDEVIEPSDSSLAVFEPGEANFYVRFLQERSDPQKTYLKFMGDVPEGATVQIMESSRSDLLDGAKTSIYQAIDAYPGTHPSALLCFSCAGRRVFLGREVAQEYDVLQSLLNSKIPVAGFYTYGEIAPLEQSGKSHFHNFTMVSLLLGVE